MGVHDTFGIMARRMDSGVDDEPGGVNHMLGVLHDIALKIDLYQAGRRDFAEMHAIGVEQKVLLGPRCAC